MTASSASENICMRSKHLLKNPKISHTGITNGRIQYAKLTTDGRAVCEKYQNEQYAVATVRSVYHP